MVRFTYGMATHGTLWYSFSIAMVHQHIGTDWLLYDGCTVVRPPHCCGTLWYTVVQPPHCCGKLWYTVVQGATGTLTVVHQWYSLNTAHTTTTTATKTNSAKNRVPNSATQRLQCLAGPQGAINTLAGTPQP